MRLLPPAAPSARSFALSSALSLALGLALSGAALLACREPPPMVEEQASSSEAGASALTADGSAGASVVPTSAAPSVAAAKPTASALPAIRGAQGGPVNMVSWFAARQVDRAQLASFLAAHGGGRVDSECQATTIGSPAEPALVCLDQLIDKAKEQVHDRVQLLVVRNGSPAIAAGLFTAYYSWTEPVRFVDLAMTLAPDGQSLTVGDRGPAGSFFMLSAPGALEPKMGEAVGCDQARERAAGASPEIGQGVTKLCAERGVWPYQNGHFRRPRT